MTMVNQILVDYIKSVKAQGYENASIVEALHNNGWQDKDINEAFSFISLAAGAPVMPSSVNSPIQPAVPISGTNKNFSMIKEEISRNSPFSVGLAVILFVSLFILVNKIINDIGIPFSNNINNKLILDGVIIIPFLFVSFLLFGIASNDRKRYIILCQPYFVVSAFLFLRLLWRTGAYVLDTNATYGVYIVLIMALLVLSGFILFLQRFFKS